MAQLYLVRHGQASFGAEDYDHLSLLGKRQSQRLGEYFGQKGLKFEAVITGTLRRHQQTFESMAEGIQITRASGGRCPEPWHMPALNEYDSEALVRTVHPGPLAKPDTPELYRHHFRLLREALTLWMQGKSEPRGMPSFADFRQGIVGVLESVRERYSGDVLMVSSGGPIATAVTHVLQAPVETTIELNMRIRNTSLTEFAYTPKRHVLMTFNTIPHLDATEYSSWVTFA